MFDRRSGCLLVAAAVMLGSGATIHEDRSPTVRADQALGGVDAISADDVWAVGTRTRPAITGLIGHWDGMHWSLRQPPAKIHALHSVDHSSSTDVWAAGQGGIVHWDGSAWRMSYDPPGGAEVIHSVVVISEDDVWGVGWDRSFNSVTVHWDGMRWTQVGPSQPDTQMWAVDADGPNDVWAVASNGVVQRWDGTSWARLPDQPDNANAVAVLGPDNVWIAGGSSEGSSQAWMSHWDGHDLVPVDIPTPGVQSGLFGLSQVSATDIWAVGKMTAAGREPRSLIEHWDGHTWHLRPIPPGIPRANGLSSVSATSADDAYAAGYVSRQGIHDRSLLLHWDGTAWTRVV